MELSFGETPEMTWASFSFHKETQVQRQLQHRNTNAQNYKLEKKA